MIRAILLSALLVSVLGVEPSAQGAGKAEVLTNQSVLDMVGAKLSKDILLAKLNATRNTFDVSVNGLVALYQGKIHQDVIRSMISLAADPKLGQPGSSSEVLTNDSIV